MSMAIVIEPEDPVALRGGAPMLRSEVRGLNRQYGMRLCVCSSSRLFVQFEQQKRRKTPAGSVRVRGRGVTSGSTFAPQFSQGVRVEHEVEACVMFSQQRAIRTDILRYVPGRRLYVP